MTVSGDAERGQPPSERRVRYTIDLTRDQHRSLKLFAINAEVDASVVIRTLLALLEEDETVGKRVRQRILRFRRRP